MTEMKEFVITVGFSFFHILERLKDIDSNCCVDKTSECLLFGLFSLCLGNMLQMFKLAKRLECHRVDASVLVRKAC